MLVMLPVWSGRCTAGAGVLLSVQRRPACDAGDDPGEAARDDGEISVSTTSEMPATTIARAIASATTRDIDGPGRAGRGESPVMGAG